METLVRPSRDVALGLGFKDLLLGVVKVGEHGVLDEVLHLDLGKDDHLVAVGVVGPQRCVLVVVATVVGVLEVVFLGFDRAVAVLQDRHGRVILVN